MSIEQDLYTALAGLADGRVYPLTLPQSPTYPAITYQRVSEAHLWGVKGPQLVRNPRFQLDVWARTYAEARTLADAVRAALVASADFDVGAYADRDIYEESVFIYRVTIDASLWHAVA